jgi:Ulp1 family protease
LLLTLGRCKFLNDAIVEFRLRFLFEKYDEQQNYHVFSSYFYKSFETHSYHKVRKWTKHTDIFSKRAIFVPINEASHWRMVVIVHPGTDTPHMVSMDRYSTPAVMFFYDSNKLSLIIVVTLKLGAHATSVHVPVCVDEKVMCVDDR